MERNDAELIQQILRGDQDAFSPLVKKYQKGVHTLAWRKIGDFHVAQEITQDAFLKAYQKLGTLKNYNQFPGWLYVIASNLCRDWLRRSRLPMDSLDADNTYEVDKVSYSKYLAEKQEADADETRREVVKKLLKKLPESERTVMMLHYLGEMTIKAISEFLGVSQNTVKSRLSRARNRLRKEEDVLQQNLGSFQLPNQLAENIMREVSHLSPFPTPVSKPIAPLALSAASAVLIFLLMGVGAQYLSRFQKPYSLDATAEPTVEIIDAVFVLDSPAKPAIRNQAGSSVTPGKNPGAGQKPDESLFTTVPVDKAQVRNPRPQWTQTKGPQGGSVQNLFAAANGDLYAESGTDLYRLSDDGRVWNRITSTSPFKGSWQLAERDDTLYVVSDTEVLASADRGETWRAFETRPEGELIGTVITDEGFYLGLANGVFRSADAGESWASLNDGALTNRKIRAITAIGNTVFVGTDSGLYRRSSDGWEQLPVGETENIRALASAEHRLYVAVGKEIKSQTISLIISVQTTYKESPSLYRSTDLGDSWQALDPEKMRSAEGSGLKIAGPINESDQALAPEKMGSADGIGLKIAGPINESETKPTPSTRIVASQENLLVLDDGDSYYSNDAGETWVTSDADLSNIGDVSALVFSDADTFYRSEGSGIYRTTDAGKTWHQFNTGLVKTDVLNLVATHNALYANMMQSLVTSSDGGESWTQVPGNSENLMWIVKFNNTIYARGISEMSPQLFQLSAKESGLTPVPGMPILEGQDYRAQIGEQIGKGILAKVQDIEEENLEESKELNPEIFNLDTLKEDYGDIIEKGMAKLLTSFFGNLAVSDTAYYMEYEQKLFRWKPGTTEWHDTGLVDEGTSDYSLSRFDALSSAQFALAVSKRTVYVGKRNGHLFQSYDEGDTWNDVTADLPFAFTSFKAVAFAGSTVYVATDTGVAYSSGGTYWHATTDVQGTPLVIERLTNDGTTVCGVNQQRVYQLNENSGMWQQITPEIPVPVTALAVDGNVLYVGTLGSGVLRFTLDESH